MIAKTSSFNLNGSLFFSLKKLFMTTSEELNEANNLIPKEPLKAIEKYKQFLSQANGFKRNNIRQN